MKYHRSVIFGFAVTLGLSAFANAQQGPAISVKPVRDGVYWADAGGGGNAGFIIGKDGVIVVDAMIAPAMAKQMLAEIAKLTAKPITTVILTHSDVDHVNGLAAFPPGLTIIAHEDCKKDIEATANSRNPSPQDRLPNKTLTKSESLTINGVRVDLLHFAPSHTSGDLQVYLPEQKIVFTGDVIATSCCGNVRSPQAYTMIKTGKNGSAEGWVQTVKGLLALNADTYVPGHGDLQTKADVQQRLARVEARREQVKKLVAEGKSLEQAKQALGETGSVPGYDLAQFPDFTTVVYNEFAKKN